MTDLTKQELTRRLVFCVSPALDELLRERAWQERKRLSELIREFCEHGLLDRISD